MLPVFSFFFEFIRKEKEMLSLFWKFWWNKCISWNTHESKSDE